MEETPVGVFFLDDESMIRALLQDSCPEDCLILGEAATCREAREKIPDLVAFDGVVVAILDGDLPDGSGEEIAQELKKARENTMTVSLSRKKGQDWGDVNFEKPLPSLGRFWIAIDDLAAQVAKCQ